MIDRELEVAPQFFDAGAVKNDAFTHAQQAAGKYLVLRFKIDSSRIPTVLHDIQHIRGDCFPKLTTH